MAVDPIHAKGVVADPLRLSNCRCLSHRDDRLIEVREAQPPRQAAVILAALGAVLLWAGAAAAIPAGEAGQHLGRAVSIEGFVQQVMCSPRACLMSFEAGWSGLVATVPAAAKDRFGDLKRFERQNVRMRGVVEDRQGKLRMEISDPSRIQVVGEVVSGQGSRVLKAEEKTPGTASAGGTEAGPPQTKTTVQVSGGASSGPKTANLSNIVRDLQEEAAVAGDAGGASELAVQGLRERVAIQAHTIQTLEEQLAELNGRLRDLEDRPTAPAESAAAGADMPGVDRWVVPARKGFSHPQPRTGWSTKRLVRELGSPIEVRPVAAQTELWVYGQNQVVTVKRERVISASGF